MHAAFALSSAEEQRGDIPAARLTLRDAYAQLDEGYLLRPYVAWTSAHLQQRCGDLDGALELLDEALDECAQYADADPPALRATREQVTIALAGLRGFVDVRRGRADRGYSAIADALRYEEDRLAADESARPANRGFHLSALHGRIEFLTSTDQHRRAVEELDALLERDELFPSAELDVQRTRFEITLAVALTELGREPARSAALLAAACAREDLGANDRLQARLRLAHFELRAGRVEAAREQLAAVRPLAAVWAAPIDRAFLAALELRAGCGAEGGELARSAEIVLDSWTRMAPVEGGLAPLRHLRERLVFGEWLRAELEVGGAEPAFELLARIQQAGTLARFLDVALAEGAGIESGEILRELVPRAGGLVAYFAAPDQLILFLADAQGVQASIREISPDLVAIGRQYALEKARPPRGAGRGARAQRIEALEARLAPTLLPPELAAQLSSWRALTIVGEDLLGAPGFESLRVPAGGDPLGVTHATSYLPSLPVGIALARRHAARGMSELADASLALFVNNSKGAAGLPDLELGPEECSALTAAFDARRVRIWSGPEASAEALSKAPLHDYGILQVFAHGLLEDDDDVTRGFALSSGEAGEGLVFGKDVLRLSAPPLVALAVCSAGRGPERAGDSGASDLTGSFLRAGADAVIASAADLELHVTHRSFAHANAALAGGASPAEAMRSARALLYAAGLSDPFDYASVRVVGLGARPLFKSRSTTRWIPAAGLALLVLLIALRLRGSRARGSSPHPAAEDH